MSLLRSAVLCCVLAGLCPMSAPAVDTLRPEQLKSGMKGYGLSVFKGTKPEKFDVEILGVLPNTFPKQDMILIRLSGADLEKHKVIAGMSGSPIYIDGKLIGALAYGWGFENEPMAGVTPIHNMLAELKPSAAPLKTVSATRATSPAAWLQPPTVAPLAPASAGDPFNTPRPLLTPLALGGFSARVIDMFAKQFERFGLLPTASGGGASRELPRWSGRIEPGMSVGASLIRGDLNATGVGTATYIDRDKVLAFGHPFFQGGRVDAPAVVAEVHTIMSSLARSFKLATPVGDAGAMVGDWQSCIVVDTKTKANMIPATVAVTNRDTGQHDRYDLEIMNNEALSPLLVQIAIAESIYAASSSSQDTTVRVNLDAELNDRTVRVSDSFFSPSGGLVGPETFAPLVGMFYTPFGRPEIKRINVTVDASLSRQTAEIKRAYFSKAQVERGETVLLSVVLKPFGEPEVTKTIPIDVPAATDTMRQLTVAVMGGSKAPPDVAPPDSLNDVLDAIEKRRRATDLVALVQTPTQGLQYRGKLLKKLPASVLDVLDDDSTRGVATAADVLQIVAPTDWVLSGQAVTRVPIRQE